MIPDKIQVGDLWESKVYKTIFFISNILELHDEKLNVKLTEIKFNRVDKPEEEYCWTIEYFLEDYIKVS